MRILVVTQYYYPEPVPHLVDLAEHLVSQGHDVTVLTGYPNYASSTGKIYAGYGRTIAVAFSEHNGVQICRVPELSNRGTTGATRLLSYASFTLASSLSSIIRTFNRPEVVFAYLPPLTVGLPAWLLARRHRARLVLQVQDLWPEALEATGVSLPSIGTRALDLAATSLYRKADRIVAISQGFGSSIGERLNGTPGCEVRVVPNHYSGPRSTRSDYKPPDAGMNRVLYAGNLGPAQDLGNLLAAASLVSENLSSES